MPDLETFDKIRQTVTLRCETCDWKFRVPVEQLTRKMCRACESKHALPQAATA